MNQQRIERLIASAVARQISHQVSQERQEEIIHADQKVRDAQNELRRLVEHTVDGLLGGGRLNSRRPVTPSMVNDQF